MRFLRRRVAAMSPREKRLALLSCLGLVGLALYLFPSLFYAILILAVCCLVYLYLSGGSRLGLNPRAGLRAPGVLRRWLLGWRGTGVPVAQRGKTRSTGERTVIRDTDRHLRQRHPGSGIYRGDALERDSFLFSPRDFLMGSYISKADSPTAEPGRPRAGGVNPREQLREKLSKGNHAVYTPNRRLSFAGEPLGTASRFTITPQRHYPLQQPGASSVGVLPPVSWDGFRKKSILSLRNSPAALSPVTVKIARPSHRSPSFEHLACSGLPMAPADPCSRESVLSVLKQSRKRDIEDEEPSFTTEQKSKRRRNDSGGSSHSAFEPLLPNGTSTQLVPKPGNLKRGMSSLAEESILKRSRTSSISSGSGIHAPRGASGSRRNPINSSYSSSIGLHQWKKPSTHSSPLSSPGSSRCQTPEGAAKRAREDDGQSPSSASSVRSEQPTSDKAPVTSKLTSRSPKIPVSTSTDSTGSGGGKRKRKIQLVSSQRDDQISLPPPPELGYSITAKDLDEEKKAAISKIQKVLETPAPEPEKTVAPPAVPTSTLPAASSSSSSTTTLTLSSLLAAPLPTSSSATIPVINLDPSPVVSSSGNMAPAASNPLLEALKMKAGAPASSTPATSTTTVTELTTTTQPGALTPKPAPAADLPQPPAALKTSTTTAAAAEPTSAFTQVLSQVMKSSSSTPPLVGASLFGLSAPNTTLAAPTTNSNPLSAAAATAPASSAAASLGNTNPLLTSGFKPIFAVSATSSAPISSPSSSASPAPESKPLAQTFKPIFGGVTAGVSFGQPASLTTSIPPSSTLSTTTTSSMFGAPTSSSAAASLFPGLANPVTGTGSTPSLTTSTTLPAAQPGVPSLFGSWSTPSSTVASSAATTQAASTGSTFQFGSVATTAPAPAPPTLAPAPAAATTAGNASFTFGATKPDPQAAAQKVFGFGQPAQPGQISATASFGGAAPAPAFGGAAPASTSAPTQSTFAFGKPAFEAPATTAQPTFGSAAAAQPKPFPFGGSATTSAPTSNPAPGPFTFGSAAAAATTATTFGTPAKPAFGGGSTGFPFGSSAAPSAAPAAAPPSFGATTQTQSSSSSATFTFGSAAPQPPAPGPAQPAPSGFNFGAAMPCPQFGTPVANNNPAPLMGGFNFGAAAAADKPAFGTSTPAFGQTTAPGPIPFGSPGTPVQGFGAAAFGSPATPSFSIGAGSKASGARQRLQARRQHNRKK